MLGRWRGRNGIVSLISATPLAAEIAQSVFKSRTGLTIAELSAREARSAGYDVSKPVLAVHEVSRDSAAARAGLRRGDLVRAVNSAEVDTMMDFQKAIAQARKSGRAVLLVQRGYRLQEFGFDLG